MQNSINQRNVSEQPNAYILTALAAPLLARLNGLIQTKPGSWSARCPAHEDRSPSLSIKDAGERILIHCHAGCPAEAVLAAVGLKWTDLYPDRWDAAREAAIAHKHRKPLQRLLYCGIDIDVERTILRMHAADLRAGIDKGIEDRARAEVARLRVMAATAEVREVAA